jgi:hypothetical protein
MVHAHQTAEKLVLNSVKVFAAEFSGQLHAMEPGSPGGQYLGPGRSTKKEFLILNR